MQDTKPVNSIVLVNSLYSSYKFQIRLLGTLIQSRTAQVNTTSKYFIHKHRSNVCISAEISLKIHHSEHPEYHQHRNTTEVKFPALSQYKMTTQVVLHIGGPGKRVTPNLTLFSLQEKMYSIYNYLNDKTWQFVPFIQWNPPDWVLGPWETLV